jgi:hypothetical protein
MNTITVQLQLLYETRHICWNVVFQLGGKKNLRKLLSRYLYWKLTVITETDLCSFNISTSVQVQQDGDGYSVLSRTHPDCTELTS